MAIFNKIRNKINYAMSELGDGVQDLVFKIDDKLDNSMDLIDRRMQRRFEKWGSIENENKFNATFGLEDFKGTSINYRVKTVIAKKEPVKKMYAEYGDIIVVDRRFYQHFGIYVGDNRVIHFQGTKTDFDLRDLKNASIKNDDMSRFLLDSKTYHILDCETATKFFGKELLIAYTPKETVLRAESKLGERNYCPVTNNCEHFAIWCKTGIHKSLQVDAILSKAVRIPVTIRIP
jgi:hypothetical protein